MQPFYLGVLSEKINHTHGTPHLPDLTPCDFSLFFTMKNRLKGSLYEIMEDSQKEVISAVGHNGEIHIQPQD
jgi:hypothetical protein